MRVNWVGKSQKQKQKNSTVWNGCKYSLWHRPQHELAQSTRIPRIFSRFDVVLYARSVRKHQGNGFSLDFPDDCTKKNQTHENQ